MVTDSGKLTEQVKGESCETMRVEEKQDLY